MAERAPLSLKQQAQLIDALVDRCSMLGGALAGESILRIEKGEAEDLAHLANRLRRMALHESQIRELVARK